MNPLSLAIALVLGSGLLVTTGGVSRAQTVVPGEEHCVVNVRVDDRLNMRSRPSARSSVLAQKRHDECGVVVQSCTGAWCRVEDGHNLGWVHRRYISMVSPAMYCVTSLAPGDRLNVRAYPSLGSRVLTRLPQHRCGIAFLPYAQGTWQKVRVSGWQGWVNRRYLSGE